MNNIPNKPTGGPEEWVIDEGSVPTYPVLSRFPVSLVSWPSLPSTSAQPSLIPQSNFNYVPATTLPNFHYVPAATLFTPQSNVNYVPTATFFTPQSNVNYAQAATLFTPQSNVNYVPAAPSQPYLGNLPIPRYRHPGPVITRYSEPLSLSYNYPTYPNSNSNQINHPSPEILVAPAGKVSKQGNPFLEGSVVFRPEDSPGIAAEIQVPVGKRIQRLDLSKVKQRRRYATRRRGLTSTPAFFAAARRGDLVSISSLVVNSKTFDMIPSRCYEGSICPPEEFKERLSKNEEINIRFSNIDFLIDHLYADKKERHKKQVECSEKAQKIFLLNYYWIDPKDGNIIPSKNSQERQKRTNGDFIHLYDYIFPHHIEKKEEYYQIAYKMYMESRENARGVNAAAPSTEQPTNNPGNTTQNDSEMPTSFHSPSKTLIFSQALRTSQTPTSLGLAKEREVSRPDKDSQTAPPDTIIRRYTGGKN